jgi:hypothetical protein
MPSSWTRSDADERQNPEEPKYFSPKRRMLIALHPKFFAALGFVVELEEGEANNYYLEDLVRDDEEREADYQDQQSRMDAGKKSGRGSTPTRRDLEGCRGHFSTLNLGNNVAKESISTSIKEARVFLTLAADERLAADEESKGLWAPNVNERHFSTLNVDGGFSTPDVDKKQQGDVATREVEEHDKCFAELYARVFSTFAANEKLAEDEKSKGFLAPNTDEKSGEHTMPTTTGWTRSPSSRPLTSTRSGVDERHFSTLSLAFRSNAIALWPLNAEESAPPCVGSTTDVD